MTKVKKVLAVLDSRPMHWVGDGFPMVPMFSFSELGEHISPFLTMGYADGFEFSPTHERRGVGMHPHRGFETVTIVYEGEVEHHDTSGQGGIIGPGDVQWMTAGRGVMHDEFHAPSFAESGGRLSMVQLWVNLPAKDKMVLPAYQALRDADIPCVPLAADGGYLRVIAGEYAGHKGPANCYSPLNVWDLNLKVGRSIDLDVPEQQTCMVCVLKGAISINGEEAHALNTVVLDPNGSVVEIATQQDTALLLLTGRPLREPIVGYGPFVMNTKEQIHQAIGDFNSGRFARA